MPEYIERIEHAYRVRGSRVSLESIVYAFRAGASVETIRDDFPSLSLEQVYGAITYYLANEQEIAAYIDEGERIGADLAAKSAIENRNVIAQLRRAQNASSISR